MSHIIKSPESGSPALKRAYWRSRRGMTELEQILLPFVAQQYESLSATQQDCYGQLLDCEDWDIYDWLQGRAQAPNAEFAELVRLIVGAADAPN